MRLAETGAAVNHTDGGVNNAVRLLRHTLLELPIRTVRAHHGGWACQVLEINRRWIFRFARMLANARDTERALRFYPLLQRVVSVPIPSTRWVSRTPKGRIRFVGYPKLPGREMPSTGLGGDRGQRWARSLAGMLRALDCVPTHKAINVGIPLMAPREEQEYRWRRYRSIARIVGSRISRGDLRRDHESNTVALEDPHFFRVRPTLGHGDLFPYHILVGPGRLGITGVIDWEDASIQDPAVSLAGLPLEGGFARRVLEFWRPGDEALWYRSRVRGHWAVGNDVIHWYRLKDGVRLSQALRNYVATIPE